MQQVRNIPASERAADATETSRATSSCENGTKRATGASRMTRRAHAVLTDEHGISIVFAMILLVVLLIVGGIIVSYAYSGYQRAQQDRTDEQAYQTVYSAAKFVQKQFKEQESKGTEPDDESWAMKALRSAQNGSGYSGTLSVGSISANATGSSSTATSASSSQSSEASSATSSTQASGSSNAPTFDDVTVRINKIPEDNISYDVACFQSSAVDDGGNPTGIALRFTVAWHKDTDDRTGKAVDHITVGDDFDKVGQ